MKKRVLSLLLSISIAFPLTGCTMMTPLTAEEEKDIALYAAAAVSKYNVKQPEGVCFVSNEVERKYDEAERRERKSAREGKRKEKPSRRLRRTRTISLTQVGAAPVKAVLPAENPVRAVHPHRILPSLRQRRSRSRSL